MKKLFYSLLILGLFSATPVFAREYFDNMPHWEVLQPYVQDVTEGTTLLRLINAPVFERHLFYNSSTTEHILGTYRGIIGNSVLYGSRMGLGGGAFISDWTGSDYNFTSPVAGKYMLVGYPYLYGASYHAYIKWGTNDGHVDVSQIKVLPWILSDLTMPPSVISIPIASSSDMLAATGALTTDLWTILAAFMGIPLGFYVIPKIIALF